MLRMPVKYKGKALMPMKATRVKKFIKEGKGKIKYDRKLKIHYLQLLEPPSGDETQDVIVGIDPGSCFDGISIVSKHNHHLNIELIHRPKKGKTSISFFKKRQAANRRIRRSRLRHRPIRFDNRTSKKLAPTIKANVDFRKWLIARLLKLFPINKAIVEDVRFNHYRSVKGKSFSHVEQGKTEFYSFIKNLGIDLELYDGFNTKKLRVNSFGVDLKSKEKDSKSFLAHCIDSLVLACNKEHKIDIESGEILDEPYITNDCFINKKVIFIEKVLKVRRCLIRLRKRYNDSKYYYRLMKGGIKQIYENISGKSNKCRIKSVGEHSNHPKQWEYVDNGKAVRYKCNVALYGGTRVLGKNYLRADGWYNRKIS